MATAIGRAPAAARPRRARRRPRDEQEQRAADGDPGRADGERGGGGAEGLRGAGGAEADGGEKDEEPGHMWSCSQFLCGVKTSRAWAAAAADARVEVPPPPRGPRSAARRDRLVTARDHPRGAIAWSQRRDQPRGSAARDQPRGTIAASGSGSRPPLTSTGSPRSGNGTSITSKSRGTTVDGNTACASRGPRAGSSAWTGG